MRTKLTKRYIDSIKPGAADVVVWDTELRGFCLRVKPSGVKSFAIQFRVRRDSFRHTIGQYGKLTLEQARTEAKTKFAEIMKGQNPTEDRTLDRDALTVGQFCDEYLSAAKSGKLIMRRGGVKKPSTIYTDAGRIERHIKPLLGKRLVKDLTSADIEGFQGDVIEGKTAVDVKTKAHGRSIVTGGHGTAARTMGLLGAVLSYAVKRGIRSDNPARGVVRPRGNKRVVHVSEERYAALGSALAAAEASGEPWQPILTLRLLALTGSRKGEIENLRWSEIDFDGRCLRLGDTKTGASIRPLGAPAIELLRAREPFRRGPYVMASHGAAPYKGLPKAWKRIRKGPLLDKLTPHGFRHGFASTANAAGFSEPTIKALIGHAGRGVTAGYIHTPDNVLLDAADKVSSIIWQAMISGAPTDQVDDKLSNVVPLERRA